MPERAVAIARDALRVVTAASADVMTLLTCANVVRQACHVLRYTRLRLCGGGVQDGEALMEEVRGGLRAAASTRCCWACASMSWWS